MTLNLNFEIFFFLTCSMYPLLLRDGQAHAYFALIVIFVMLTSISLMEFNKYSNLTKLMVSYGKKVA